MQLVLSVGDKVLDAVPIKAELYKDQDYIAALQRLMLTKHELGIYAYLQPPVFYIEAVSRMEAKRK